MLEASKDRRALCEAEKCGGESISAGTEAVTAFGAAENVFAATTPPIMSAQGRDGSSCGGA